MRLAVRVQRFIYRLLYEKKQAFQKINDNRSNDYRFIGVNMR